MATQQGSFNLWEALRARFWKAGGFAGTAYSGPPLDIAGDNNFQDKVLDTAGNPMNLMLSSGSGRARTHFNNPNGVSCDGQIATPAAPTVTPTGGAGTTWSYKIVARASNGTTPASSAGTTAAGAATLSGAAYNTITWTAVTGAVSYDIYRTTAGGTPNTTGYVGNVLAINTLSFVDTGIAGDSRTAPTTNTTGVFEAINTYDISIMGLASVQNTTITNAGSAGATAYSYRVSAVTAAGTENASAAAASTATGNATLTTTNYNIITFAPVPGAKSYNIYRSASSGTPGSTGLIGSVNATSSATTVVFNDTGIAATGTTPTTNNTGTLATTGGLFQTSTVANQYKHQYAGNWVPAASTSGTDTAAVNGTVFISEVFIPAACQLTGISYLLGSVGGTDKVVVILFDATGAVVANSILNSSVTAGTTATMQRVPFTAVYQALGPGKYYLGVQFNGTTAKLRTQVFGDHETTSVSQTFNTPAAITPPTSFTASVGPVAMLY